jgi:hypothetical protein
VTYVPRKCVRYHKKVSYHFAELFGKCETVPTQNLNPAIPSMKMIKKEEKIGIGNSSTIFATIAIG